MKNLEETFHIIGKFGQNNSSLPSSLVAGITQAIRSTTNSLTPTRPDEERKKLKKEKVQPVKTHILNAEINK